MTWTDGPVTVLIGDVRDRLAELPAESVHCIVTSPPYWSLRDYGVPGQLGLEPTPEEYVCRMVEVFREVRRVLRPDGTLWCNLGDSYASNGGKGDTTSGFNERWSDGAWSRQGKQGGIHEQRPMRGRGDLKPKDLVMMPARVALALQADGWYLRSDIIWGKSNPMPESVTDRPTTSHEHVFLLARSERYFYDAEAIREPHQADRRDSRDRRTPEAVARGDQTDVRCGNHPAGRNLRSVWTIATQPYPEAHFATFPEELARRCIAAGTSERGCCPECGAPWERIVERGSLEGPGHENYRLPKAQAAKGDASIKGRSDGWWPNHHYSQQTTGWCPTCTHGRDPIPCTVLDPFAGSGTTLAVARRMGRRAIGIELQPDYLPLIQRRVSEAALPLLEMLEVR